MKVNLRNVSFLGVPRGSTQTLASWSGLVVWYAADQITGLSNGATVAQWNDLATTKHLTQSTEARKPVYTTNVLNGKPSVRFTSANTHWMSVSDAGMPTGNCTWVCVARCTGLLGDGALYTLHEWGTEGIGQANIFCYYRNATFGTGNRCSYSNYGDVAPQAGTEPNVENQFVVYLATKVGSTFNTYACKRTLAAYNPSGGMNTVLSGNMRVGGLYSNSSYLNGDIFEMAAWNRVLTSTEINDVLTFLGAKYAITINA